MKTKKKLITILIAITVVGTGVGALAGSGIDKLVGEMSRERDQVLVQVVEGWKGNEDPEALRKLVLRLVDVHVRLLAVDRSADQDFAGRVIGSVKVGSERQEAKALAGAVARAYYSEKGLNVNTRDRFAGVYHVWTVRK